MINAKALVPGLLLFFSAGIKGQQVQFKEPIRQSIRTCQILEHDSFYYSVGQFYEPLINKFSVNLIKLNSRGQLIKENRLIDSTISFYPSNHISLETTYDGNFVTTLDIMGVTPSQNGILKFDQNLDTLWLKYPLQDSEVRAFYQVKQLPDSGFVITGYVYDQVKNMYHANLLRTDKNGQLLWEKVYKEPDTVSLHPYQVYPAPDGGFLMAGRKVYLPDGQTQDPLLIRTDSAGNLLWKKTYGGNQIDGVACAAYRDDGNIMLHYTQGKQPLQQAHRLMAVYSLVDDKTGQEVHKKPYPFIDIRGLFSHHLIKDGKKFIATGELAHQDTNLVGGVGQAYTIAVDENLNDLWHRYYNAQESQARPDEESTLYDLRPTADGGYVAGGYILIFDTIHINVNLGYNGWIVKMDSMGCVEQSCVNRIGVEDISPFKAKSLEVYPNPSRGTFHIELNSDTDGRAILYDLKGVQLKETELIKGVGILNPEKNIAPGMYVIRVMDTEGNTATQKVVIQK